MARLQWEQIAAPNLSTRDIAIAGQAVGGAFDRMAAMFQQRYEVQRREQTDAAVAQILGTTDPNQLQSLDPSKFGGNVNMREVAEAMNSQRRGLLVEQDTKEDLLNKQALSEYGDEMLGMMEAYRNGDEAAKAQLVTMTAENPQAARAMSLLSKEIFNAAVGGEEFREQQRATDVQEGFEQQRIGIANQELGLRRRSLSLEEAARGQSESGYRVGAAMAQDLRTTDPKDALQKFYDSPQYQALGTAAERLAAERAFTTQQPVLATPGSDAYASAGGQVGSSSAAIGALTAAGDRVSAALETPEIRAAQRAASLDGKVKADEVISSAHGEGGITGGRTFLTEGILRGKVDQVLDTLRQDGIRVDYADVQAVNEVYGTDPNPVQFTERLEARLRSLAEARGDLATLDTDKANARRDYDRAISRIQRLQAEALRFEASPRAEDKQKALEKWDEVRKAEQEAAGLLRR